MFQLVALSAYDVSVRIGPGCSLKSTCILPARVCCYVFLAKGDHVGNMEISHQKSKIKSQHFECQHKAIGNIKIESLILGWFSPQKTIYKMQLL